jgi:ribonuclease P protein subunit POP4
VNLVGQKIERSELIGFEATVVGSTNKANIGIKGKITDETRNTLKIGGKIILKKDITIEIETDGKKITIEGKKLTKSPEERIKIR